MEVDMNQGHFECAKLGEKCSWIHLPDSLFLHILRFLEPCDVTAVARVCRKWRDKCTDDLLWKYFCCKHWNIEYCPKTELSPWCSSWLEEYKRLFYHVPIKETSVLREHEDEVLHVTFSHNGKYVASSSKDCSAIVWEVSGCSLKIKNKLTFRELDWSYVQFCEFSNNDELLLVSGVDLMNEFRGDIVIYQLNNPLTNTSKMVHKAPSEPYDIFGAWLSDDFYISGDFYFTDPNEYSSMSELIANHIYTSQTFRVCEVSNKNASSVRSVQVAKPTSSAAIRKYQLSDNDVLVLYSHGSLTYTPHQIAVRKLTLPQVVTSLLLDEEAASEQQNISNGTVKNRSHSAKDTFIVETYAHIIGMKLSPDQNYVYVNCRPWLLDNVNPENMRFAFDETPVISNDIEVRVFHLATLSLVRSYHGHRAFTPNTGCFFIFLDATEQLLSSGAEDKHAHVWDHHFRAKVATLKGHESVVNAVAFNPCDQEMLISASDDHTLRVWCSHRKAAAEEENEQLQHP